MNGCRYIVSIDGTLVVTGIMGFGAEAMRRKREGTDEPYGNIVVKRKGEARPVWFKELLADEIVSEIAAGKWRVFYLNQNNGDDLSYKGWKTFNPSMFVSVDKARILRVLDAAYFTAREQAKDWAQIANDDPDDETAAENHRRFTAECDEIAALQKELEEADSYA